MTWHPETCHLCSHHWHGLRCIRCTCETAWIEPTQTAPTTAGQPKPLADLRETANLGTPPRASRERTLDGHRTMRLLWPRLARQLRNTVARGASVRWETPAEPTDTGATK